MSVSNLVQPLRPEAGITGLFWLTPTHQQRRRIKELASRLDPWLVAILCRRPLPEVRSILGRAA